MHSGCTQWLTNSATMRNLWQLFFSNAMQFSPPPIMPSVFLFQLHSFFPRSPQVKEGRGRMKSECLASLQLTFSITKGHFNGTFVNEHTHTCLYVYAGMLCIGAWEFLTGVYLCSLPTCCMAGQQNKYIRCLAQRTHLSFSQEKVNYLKWKQEGGREMTNSSGWRGWKEERWRRIARGDQMGRSGTLPRRAAIKITKCKIKREWMMKQMQEEESGKGAPSYRLW